MISPSAHCKDLKTLTEEILVAWRLGQHCRVSELCAKCAQLLTASYDEELENSEEQELASAQGEDWNMMNSLCNRLRTLSRLAGVYNDVLEFVRAHDLVAFSRLIGASKWARNSRRGAKPDWPNYELMERTLRQSVFLLRLLNRAQQEVVVDELEQPIEKSNIRKEKSIEFGRHVIEMESAGPRSELSGEKLKSSMETSRVLDGQLQTHWFGRFFDTYLAKPYHLDRFAILVALWIIGSQCKHRQLEELMCELCDQIFHQEANSCQLDELMQLTQVGSFWVTHKKRFQATFKRSNFAPSLGQVLDEENVDLSGPDEDYDQSGSPSSSSSSSSVRLDNYGARKEENWREDEGRRVDFSSKLRRLVDEELLVGRACLLCQREASGPLLEPIQAGAAQCAGCGLRRSSQIHCSLSHKTMQLVPLGSLAEVCSGLERVQVVAAGQWAERALNAARRRHASAGVRGGGEPATVGERVEVEEKFERLTVLRGSGHSDSEQEDHDDDDDDGQLVSSDESADQDQRQSDEELEVLDEFMEARLAALGPSGGRPAAWRHWSMGSESLQMIGYLRARRQSGRELVVLGSDLVLCDWLDNERLLDIQLQTCRRQRGASGARQRALQLEEELVEDYDLIYACRQRSPTSQLLLGCGRFFSQMEMLRSTGRPQRYSAGGRCESRSMSASDLHCPCCECPLIELRPGLNVDGLGQPQQ